MGVTSLKPIVGVTCDVGPHARSGRATCSVSLAYEECIARAGGVAIVLPPLMECLEDHIALCDAFVFTGGDDPKMEEFGEITHPKATPMDPRRQSYEVTLMRALQEKRPEAPVLGICLGMQLMSPRRRRQTRTAPPRRAGVTRRSLRPRTRRHCDGRRPRVAGHGIRDERECREPSSPGGARRGHARGCCKIARRSHRSGARSTPPAVLRSAMASRENSRRSGRPSGL